MKKLLSFRHLLLLALAVFGINSGLQAGTKISTLYTNNPGYLYAFGGTGTWIPSYITFKVKNNNPYPVVITDVDFLHFVDSLVPFSSGSKYFSNNGATYSLVRQPGDAMTTPGTTAGGPGNQMANLPWEHIATSAPVYAPATGVINVLSGIQATIDPGKEVRYAIVCSDTIVVRGTNGANASTPGVTPIPGTFTTAGVELYTVDPLPVNALGNNLQYIWLGQYGISTTYLQAQNANIGMDGGITISRKGPNINVVGSPVCEGGTVILTATLPVGVPANNPRPKINWTGPNGFTDTGYSITINNMALAKGGQYSATYSVADETSAPTSVNVIVKPLPPAPTITARTAYCINDQFEPVTVNGQNIVWFTVPTGTTGTNIPPYVNTSSSGTYTWYASQTVNGCESATRTGVTITVAPKPAAPIVTSPIGFCEGEPASPLTAVGQDLRWYYFPGGGIGAITAPTPGTSVKDTTSYWVSQTVNGCEGPRAKIDVLVTFKPNGYIVTNRNPSELCQGDTMSFWYYGSGLPTTAYAWDMPGGGVQVSPGVPGAGPLTVRFDSAGMRNITVTASNYGCSSLPFINMVKVNPTPFAAIASKSDVCLNANETISLIQYTHTIDTFYWSFDGGILQNYSTDQGPYGVYWATPGRKVVKLTVADELCRYTTTDTLLVHEAPDASIKGYRTTDGTICAGDSLRLEPGTLVASSRYKWSPERFFDFYAEQAVTYARVDFDSYIKLEVEDAYGCKNEDSLKVSTKPCCELFFPNVFSPNGDGKNDKFRTISQGNHGVQTFRIVNRWGQAVYETNDEHQGWDGNMNAKPQDAGTYFYYIKYRCLNKWTEQKGEFMLVR